jgi:hypothetical protein
VDLTKLAALVSIHQRGLICNLRNVLTIAVKVVGGSACISPRLEGQGRHNTPEQQHSETAVEE